MKKLIWFIVPMFILILGTTSCEEEDVIGPLPMTIENYINANYPNYIIENAEIDYLCDSTQVFEVELENGSDEVELVFDDEDNFLFEETEISDADLPAAVINSIAANFPNYIIDDEVSLLTYADGTLQYEVELEDGQTEVEALFAADGTLICHETEIDED